MAISSSPHSKERPSAFTRGIFSSPTFPARSDDLLPAAEKINLKDSVAGASISVDQIFSADIKTAIATQKFLIKMEGLWGEVQVIITD